MEKFTHSIHYCVQWSRGYNRPSKLLTESQAKEKHDCGELYTALLGDRDRPDCFLEFSAFRSIVVEFLGQALRTYLCYGFQEKAPNRFFISSARVPEFPNEVDEAVRATGYYFKTSGQVAIERYESHPGGGVGSRIVGCEERQVDVTNNWEPFPEFGNYAGLAKRDRGIPALNDT